MQRKESIPIFAILVYTIKYMDFFKNEAFFCGKIEKIRNGDRHAEGFSHYHDV